MGCLATEQPTYPEQGRLGLVVTSASCNTSPTAKSTNAKLFEKLHVQ